MIGEVKKPDIFLERERRTLLRKQVNMEHCGGRNHSSACDAKEKEIFK